MKKVLIGFAAAAMAVVGIGSAASAGGAPTEMTIYETLIDELGGDTEEFLDEAGWDAKFDTCGGPFYTVFFPSFFAVLDGVANALGYLDALSALDNAPDLVKGLLSYHVVPGVYSGEALTNELFTNLTNSVGASLTISDGDGDDNFSVDGNVVDTDNSITTCNGVIHFIGLTVLKPAAAPGSPSCGANVVGQCTPAGSGSGSGLPKTGSESMALTYAALASLIAGAGVLVIRRRSIA